jgi:hypothetical protein
VVVGVEKILDEQRGRLAELQNRLVSARALVSDRAMTASKCALDPDSGVALDKAEVEHRVAEDRARSLTAALALLEGKIFATENELASALRIAEATSVAARLEKMASGFEADLPEIVAALQKLSLHAANCRNYWQVGPFVAAAETARLGAEEACRTVAKLMRDEGKQILLSAQTGVAPQPADEQVVVRLVGTSRG